MNPKLKLRQEKKAATKDVAISELLQEKCFLANESINPSRSSKPKEKLSDKNFLDALLKKIENYPAVLVLFFFLKGFLIESIRIAMTSINRSLGNKNKFENKNKILCVTHFIGKTSNEYKEVYFGNIFEKYQSRDVVYYFINHTNMKESRVTQYLNENFDFDFKVSEKSSSYFEFLKLISAQLSGIRRLSDTSYFKLSKINGGNHRPYFVIRNHFSRSAFNNLFLTSSILKFVEERCVEKIVMTFEGNPYESCLHREVTLKFPKIECVLYQHAPITERHIGIKAQVNRYLGNVMIGTSGKYTEELFHQYLDRADHKKVIVLGSNKSFPGNTQAPVELKKVCLIAPEGTMSCVTEMLEIGLGLAQLMKDFIFIFRVHPVLEPELNKIIKTYGYSHANFIISSEVLANDLEKSGVCIYRGSSVGIEAAGFGVVPVFYSKDGDYGLDPIYFENRGDMQTNSLEKVVEVIKSLEEMPPQKFSELVNNLINFNQRYFSPLSHLHP